MFKVFLHTNWQYKQADKKNSWKNASVPGNIHLDLLKNKEIPDPYYRLNEQQQQWIGEVDWEYFTGFTLTKDQILTKNIDIVFEGLDTYADVYLNDELILQADNMYCGWRIDVNNFLKEGINQLRIYFHSVIKRTLPEFENNRFEYGANNSQPEPKLSMFTRKPGYHYGWDWGPRLLTCGVWRPVYLEFWDDIRLDNVRFVQKSLSDNIAELQLEAEVISSAETAILFNLSNSESAFLPITKGFSVKSGSNKLLIDFEIVNPKRWWCNGLGVAYLYDFKLELFLKEKFIDKWEEKIGLRRIELIHKPDDYGKSFYFKLNDIPVFIKGSNFLPVDYFLPGVKKEDYKKLLNDVVDTNMNMLRLWGGAVYEEKIFYDLCDELGIMVWQDFMFACAMYPADEINQRRIRDEAVYNVKRLRNHTCLALWCGNNEIDEGWHTWGWQDRYGYSEQTSNLIWNYYCKIFHEILPEAVKEFDTGRPYWQSSPKYGFKDLRSRVDGDMHYWGVWFLNHPKEMFKEYLPRFMSEYGLQSMPELKTFKEYSIPEDWDLKAEVMQAHQRQYPNTRKGQFLGGYDMMLKYVESEYDKPEDFELLAYTSQLLQADYLKYAIEVHRRNKPYCMGTMYWQFNDVWPVTSWSTIDYYGRWKAANYAVQKAYNPVIVSVEDDGENLKIFIVNDLLKPLVVELEIKLINFTGDILFEKKLDVSLEPNSSKSFFSLERKNLIDERDINNILLFVQLKQGRDSLSENIFYFVNTNKLKLEQPDIKYSVEKLDEVYLIKIKSSKLVKNLKINLEDSDGFLSDNYFDLLPNMEKCVTYKTNEPWNAKINFIHYFIISEKVKVI